MQPGETPKAYRAFVTYRDLGYGRTLQKVAVSLSLSVSRIAQLSRTYHWKERLKAWTQECDAQWQETLAEYRLSVLKQQIRIADAMCRIVESQLHMLLDNPERLGREVLKDIPRLALAAAELSRAALYPRGAQDNDAPKEIHISICEDAGSL